MFGNNFFKFGIGKKEKEKEELYKSSYLESISPKERFNAFAKLNANDNIEEVDEEAPNEPENSFRRRSQDFSSKMPSYSLIKNNLFEVEVTPISTKILKVNNFQNDEQSQKRDVSNPNRNNVSKKLVSEEVSLYDKSDYEKTLRLGTLIESDSILETTNDKKVEEKKCKSKSYKKSKSEKKEENQK